ncbi:pyridoxamine 5'-phosphate oxidase family protein [Flavobacterium sp. GT3R68]|uniref:pyridoxamine 5'-phosphate oxidase family protein n=1 Tax=Flavobacterium sp. GT3R68 TaxID=2594437 RepID=UPI000F85CF27|nr:pyridoxamine 5'-phosphate oxidase family protein [Flavobacterium sp. GT3R68]RTY90622.1 general stress protein [Flavobacterium sp. GSN2]TRW89852.1 general stress protein [Flavobacterium sp. GT3R68]
MSTKNLYSEEAKEKIKELAVGIDFAIMVTKLGNKPSHMVPMSTKKVDDNGDIWFLSGKDSHHNSNLAIDNDMHLLYADKSAMRFLNVYGKGFISTDINMIKELYQSSDDAWFEGVNDPNLTAIRVQPLHAFYWDPKDNKLVTLLKMGVAAVTGKEPDLMNEGELRV